MRKVSSTNFKISFGVKIRPCVTMSIILSCTIPFFSIHIDENSSCNADSFQASILVFVILADRSNNHLLRKELSTFPSL